MKPCLGQSSQKGKTQFQSKVFRACDPSSFFTYAVCSMWNKRNRYHADSRQNRVSYDGSLPTKPRIMQMNNRFIGLVFLKVTLTQIKVWEIGREILWEHELKVSVLHYLWIRYFLETLYFGMGRFSQTSRVISWTRVQLIKTRILLILS